MTGLVANYLEETFKPFTKQIAEKDLTHWLTKEMTSKWKKITLRELKHEIKSYLNAKKSPGYDLLTEEVLTQLPKSSKSSRQTIIIYSMLHWDWDISQEYGRTEVIMIPKPGKPPNN